MCDETAAVHQDSLTLVFYSYLVYLLWMQASCGGPPYYKYPRSCAPANCEFTASVRVTVAHSADQGLRSELRPSDDPMKVDLRIKAQEDG